jgi:hypothetical protein
VSFLTTHRRGLSFPIKGTLALHCQVARLASESFLMLVRILSSWHPDTTKFCVIAKPTDKVAFNCFRIIQNVAFTKAFP